MVSTGISALQACIGHWFHLERLFDTECLKLFVAEALNTAIGLGAMIVKVPQIYTIVKSESVEGLSPVAFYFDTLVSTSFAAYHFLNPKYSFKMYSDSVFTTIQNLLLVLLLWVYSAKKTKETKNSKATKDQPSLVVQILQKLPLAAAYVLITTLFLSIPDLSLPELINQHHFLRDNLHPSFKVKLAFLNSISLRIVLLVISSGSLVVSRSSQIMQNFTNQSTGSLSLTTNALQFLGASARVFTTLVGEGGSDSALISSHVMAAALSGIVCLQIVTSDDKKSR